MNPKFGVSGTWFAVDGEGRLVGIVTFRHTLTPFYRDSGHIGYSVRPAQRRKGYATAILMATLEKAREAGLESVKLVCRRSNKASAKTIQKCGGKLLRAFGDETDPHEEYEIAVL